MQWRRRCGSISADWSECLARNHRIWSAATQVCWWKCFANSKFANNRKSQRWQPKTIGSEQLIYLSYNLNSSRMAKPQTSMKLRRNYCWKINWVFSVLLDIAAVYELFDLRWVALNTELSMLWSMTVCLLWKQILNVKTMNNYTFTWWVWKWPASNNATCASVGFWKWCMKDNIFTVSSSLQTAKYGTKTRPPQDRTDLTSVLVLRTSRTVWWLS